MSAPKRSAIARVAGGVLQYRGHDVCELARTRSLEEVAALLWTGDLETNVFDTPLHVVAGGGATGDLPFINRAQSMLPLVAARDALAGDLDADGAARTGWRIANLLASIAAESQELEPTIEETLARAWDCAPAPRNQPRPAETIRAALIVCAERGLDIPAQAVRRVAAASSNPYAVVLAGLAALEGERSGGGAIARVAALFEQSRRSRDLRRALAGREPIAGFGDPLYRDGDPAVQLLLSMLPKSKELTFARRLATAGESATGEKPTLEFALVALEQALALPRDAALTILAIGRSIGWVAHAVEEYGG